MQEVWKKAAENTERTKKIKEVAMTKRPRRVSTAVNHRNGCDQGNGMVLTAYGHVSEIITHTPTSNRTHPCLAFKRLGESDLCLKALHP